MDIDKLRKNTIPYNEIEEKYMEDYEYQKEYLNLSLEEYITDGDFNKFYKSLEKVIKSRESISSFAKKCTCFLFKATNVGGSIHLV